MRYLFFNSINKYYTKYKNITFSDYIKKTKTIYACVSFD